MAEKQKQAVTKDGKPATGKSDEKLRPVKQDPGTAKTADNVKAEKKDMKSSANKASDLDMGFQNSNKTAYANLPEAQEPVTAGPYDPTVTGPDKDGQIPNQPDTPKYAEQPYEQLDVKKEADKMDSFKKDQAQEQESVEDANRPYRHDVQPETK